MVDGCLIVFRFFLKLCAIRITFLGIALLARLRASLKGIVHPKMKMISKRRRLHNVFSRNIGCLI